jgi:hypothetical protein
MFRYMFCVAQQLKLFLVRHVMRVLDHARTHTNTHTPDRTPLSEWSSLCTGHYIHNAHQTQVTNFQALGVFRTRDPSNEAAADLQFRPHGRRNRLSNGPITFTCLLTYLLTYSMEQSPSWEANQWALQLVKKFPAFMEPESPSPCPQVPATCSYPEPTPSSPHDPLQLPEDQS